MYETTNYADIHMSLQLKNQLEFKKRLECRPMPNLTISHMQQFQSRQCLHWISWPGKPTPRIKHQVTSCHRAEVLSIWRFTCPTLCPNRTTDLRCGSRTHHVWYEHHSLATDWHYYCRFPNFPCSREWWAQRVDFGSSNWRKLGFSPLKFFRRHMLISHRT